jgi:hypothetical protein
MKLLTFKLPGTAVPQTHHDGRLLRRIHREIHAWGRRVLRASLPSCTHGFTLPRRGPATKKIVSATAKKSLTGLDDIPRDLFHGLRPWLYSYRNTQALGQRQGRLRRALRGPGPVLCLAQGANTHARRSRRSFVACWLARPARQMRAPSLSDH